MGCSGSKDAANNDNQLVKESWGWVKPEDGNLTPVGELFYTKLFVDQPELLETLFKGTDQKEQAGKLVAMIDSAVAILDDQEKITTTLKDLGTRHAGYGVTDEHYPAVGKALIATLKEGLGEKLTKEHEDAWVRTYDFIQAKMKEGAASEEGKKNAAAWKAKQNGEEAPAPAAEEAAPAPAAEEAAPVAAAAAAPAAEEPPKEKKRAKMDFDDIRSKLPTNKADKEQKKRRKQLFKDCDPNGNGYLSLAEIDLGVREVLKLDEVFDCKPVIMRAFQAAKGAGNRKGKESKHGADFVEFREFRLFLVYLSDYFEVWQMFEEVDSGDDARINLDEFKAALGKIEQWGLKIDDAEAEFKAIDTNGGGVVLFDEFAHWALDKKLDAEDDDSDSDADK